MNLAPQWTHRNTCTRSRSENVVVRIRLITWFWICKQY